MKKYSFWDAQWHLVLLGILNILVVLGVCWIYNVAQEIVIYVAAFPTIFWVGAIAASHHKCKVRQKHYDQHLEEELLRQSSNDMWETRHLLQDQADFFGLWSHQIKTPIAALQALFQSADEDTSAYRQELFRIERYVETALQYLRFDDMSGDLMLTKCNLEDMVKQVVKKYAPQFIHNHLSIDLENLQQVVLTDEKWFCFVLEQVLSNAIKYTREGGIRISANENADGVEVVIADTGIGVRREDLPRIFDKGYTGYNGRMDKKASGLGLYLCKGICDKLGHGIRIESAEGEGTKVYITCDRRDVSGVDLTKM